MGGVREGEKTSHHALQDRPNRFPCGELGIRIRRWLAALACGSKRHPSLSPPQSRVIPSWGSGLCTFTAVVWGPCPSMQRGCLEVWTPCAQGPSVRWGARDQSLPTQCASYTVSALLQHALPVLMALKYRRLLGFGKRYLQGFTYKMFSLSDSITNRKMAKPDTARTQLLDFQHGGWEKRKKRNKWTKPGISVTISNALFAKLPQTYLLDMLSKPQVNWDWVCGTTWESSRFRPWSKCAGTCSIRNVKDKTLGIHWTLHKTTKSALFLHLWKRKKKEKVNRYQHCFQWGQAAVSCWAEHLCVGLHLCDTKHPSSDFWGTGGVGPQLSVRQFRRQMEKAKLPTPLDLCVCHGAGICKCHWL